MGGGDDYFRHKSSYLVSKAAIVVKFSFFFFSSPKQIPVVSWKGYQVFCSYSSCLPCAIWVKRYHSSIKHCNLLWKFPWQTNDPLSFQDNIGSAEAPKFENWGDFSVSWCQMNSLFHDSVSVLAWLDARERKRQKEHKKDDIKFHGTLAKNRDWNIDETVE